MLKKNKSLIILTTLSSLIFTSCQASSTVHFDMFIYNSTDTFIHSLQSQIIQDSKKENRNYEYDVHYAESSQLTQNTQIASVLSTGSDKLLLVNLVDRLAASAIIEKAHATSSSAIFFNREPLLEDMLDQKDVFFVGSDANKEGSLQAEEAMELFGSPSSLNSAYDLNGDNKIQIMMLKGETGHQDAEERSKMCIQALKNRGYEVEIVSSLTCDWSSSVAYTKVKANYPLITQKVELMFSNNDDMALGAIKFFKEENIFKTEDNKNIPLFPIIGVDATDVGKKAVQEGWMYGTILNDASNQADAIMNLADYLSGAIKLEDIPYTFTNGNYIYINGEKITHTAAKQVINRT